MSKIVVIAWNKIQWNWLDNYVAITLSGCYFGNMFSQYSQWSMKQTNQPTETGLLSGTIFSHTAIHDYLAPHTRVVQLTKHLTYHKSFQVTNCVAFGNIVESPLLFFKLSWSISILKDIYVIPTFITVVTLIKSEVSINWDF